MQWDVSDDMMLYATYVEGFKSAGFNNRSNANPDSAVIVPGTVGAWEFDKEQATSCEAGMKASFAGVAELNVAVFFTRYDDLQTSVFDGGVGFNVTNAALPQYDASGERKKYTPRWKGVVSADFNHPVSDALELRATVDLQYSDQYNGSPQLDPRTIQKNCTKRNARISLAESSHQWEVALVGSNLTDERTISYGGTAVLGGVATGGTGMGYYAFTDRPRSYALQARYRF